MYSIPTENSSINVKDKSGETALHRAARKNDVRQITSLSSLRADVNAKNIYNEIPLHSAATGNSVESHYLTIEALLKNGAGVNAQDKYGNTALQNLKNPSVRLVRLFLNYNASISVKDKTGLSFMCNVFMRNRNDVAQLLVDHHFNYLRAVDNFGTSFLHWAFYFQNLGVVRLILKKEYGRIFSVDNFGRTPVNLFFTNEYNEGGETLQFILKYFRVESFGSQGSCILDHDLKSKFKKS